MSDEQTRSRQCALLVDMTLFDSYLYRRVDKGTVPLGAADYHVSRANRINPPLPYCMISIPA
jgi:hypothetical protein